MSARPCVGFPGYRVDADGVVTSTLTWRGDAGPRVMAPRVSSTGYLCVRLRRDGRQVQVPVHKLVLEAFVGPRPEGMVTRHLNGDPLDARLSNLKYGTHQENALDVIAHGRHQEVLKTHCVHGHPLSGDNLWIGTNANGRPKRRCRECERNRWAAYHQHKLVSGGVA
jgi:hypothetical protein